MFVAVPADFNGHHLQAHTSQKPAVSLILKLVGQ